MEKNLFNIESEKIGNFHAYRLVNKNNNDSFTIIPELGFHLHSLILKNNEWLDSYSSDELTLDNFGTSFKGAKLAPFVNRLRNGQYNFENNSYQFKCNGKNISHGFVWNKNFEIIDKGEGQTLAWLEGKFTYNGDIEGYPFPFIMYCKAILRENSDIEVSTTIENTSSQVIPFADGWHPYFNLPASVDEWLIKLPTPTCLEIDSDKIPTGKKDLWKDFLLPTELKGKNLDHCFGPLVKSGHSEVKLFHQQTRQKINLWFQTGKEGYNFIQLYTPSQRNSIAIEPMTSAPDAFNNELGLLKLVPQEIRCFKWGFHFF